MSALGIKLVKDIEQARKLPILNAPAGARRIRITRPFNWVYYFVRLEDGIQKCVGELTQDGDAVKLLPVAGGTAYTRKP